MKITKELVKKLAKLSNLDISEPKAEVFTDQLQNIFEYFETLKEVDTSDVKYVSFNENNNVRQDSPTSNELERQNILKNVPTIKNGYVQTKSVLGKVT